MNIETLTLHAFLIYEFENFKKNHEYHQHDILIHLSQLYFSSFHFMKNVQIITFIVVENVYRR